MDMEKKEASQQKTGNHGGKRRGGRNRRQKRGHKPLFAVSDNGVTRDEIRDLADPGVLSDFMPPESADVDIIAPEDALLPLADTVEDGVEATPITAEIPLPTDAPIVEEYKKQAPKAEAETNEEAKTSDKAGEAIEAQTPKEASASEKQIEPTPAPEKKNAVGRRISADAVDEDLPMPDMILDPTEDDILGENTTTVPMPESMRTPVEVVGVRFKPAGKVYYFDPDGKTLSDGDTVIVETARGMEFGFVVNSNRTVMSGEIVAPLKKIVRMANEEDQRHYEENNKRREEAFEICRQKIEEHKIDMKLVDVEYTFDNNKLLFYFTAEGRVDFRELVKDLASVFRTRIELRQIGIRDEAKLMGGLGICGRPFCCHSFLSDFVQVSIKMAKEQNLSLNSAKISGTCGRLMCCLRYEYDVYEEEIKKTPKMDAVISTPDGDAVVCEVMPLAGMVRAKALGGRNDVAPKLYHRDDVQVKGKMSWKTGTITYLDGQKSTEFKQEK